MISLTEWLNMFVDVKGGHIEAYALSQGNKVQFQLLHEIDYTSKKDWMSPNKKCVLIFLKDC